MNLQKEFYSKLKSDKIKINWNKKPIKMDLFLSFLTVTVNESKDHLGSSTGWTRFENEEYKLIIGGGIIQGHWLDSLQYGTKLDNPYNNYVNPFYLFNILSEEGKKFFVEYYKEDIDIVLKCQSDKVKSLTEQLKIAKKLKLDILQEVKSIRYENES